MNHDPDMLLLVLVRTTLALAAAGAVTAATLRLSRANWPTVHRLGWVLTLLVGWTFLRLPLTLPWYDAPRTVTVAIAEPTPVDALPQGFEELTPFESPAESPPESPAEFALPAELPLSVIESTPAVETAVIAPDRPRFIASGAALTVWALGVALLPVAWLVGYLRFVRSLGARSMGDESWQAEWRELQAADRVARPIPLRVTAGLGPLLCRLPRGYELLVPEPLWRELDADQRRAILRHELAHYRRGDVWKSLAAQRFGTAALVQSDRLVGGAPLRRRGRMGLRPRCNRRRTGHGLRQRARPVGRAARFAGLRLGSLGKNFGGPGSPCPGGAAPEDSMFKKTGLIAVGLLLAVASGVQLNLVAKQPAANDSSADVAVEGGDEPQSPGKARGSSADTTQPVVVEDSDSGNGNSTPAARMVAQAKHAYRAHQAAFEAETVTMPSVYEWSRRWMEAARGTAGDKAGRVAALRGHLERMQDLHKTIAKLYEVGTKGGEAKDLAAASFYVAEAEQWLAATEAASGERLGLAIPPGSASQVLDLKIKIAELEGQIDQTKIALETAKVARDSAHAAVAVESGAISRSEQARIEADYNSLVAKLNTTKEQLNLWRQKLKLASPTPQIELRLPDDARSTERDSRTGQAGILDLKIRIAELNGQLNQARLTYDVAKLALEKLRAAKSAKPDSVLQVAVVRANAEMEKAQSQTFTLQEQLKLYNEKLKLTAVAVGPKPTANASHGLSSPQVAVYAGKTFDTWVGELNNDLSPGRRVEALHALTSFGTNGFGPQAAQAILDAAHRYQIFSTVDYDDGRGPLGQVALDAFHNLPVKDTWPLLLEALKSDKAERRLAAANLICNVPGKREEIVALLIGTLEDSDIQVRRNAINYLVQSAPKCRAWRSRFASSSNRVTSRRRLGLRAGSACWP